MLRYGKKISGLCLSALCLPFCGFCQDQGFFPDAGEMVPGLSQGVQFRQEEQRGDLVESGRPLTVEAEPDLSGETPQPENVSQPEDPQQPSIERTEKIEGAGVVLGLDDLAATKKGLSSLVALKTKHNLSCGRTFILGKPEKMSEGIKNLLDRFSIRGCTWSMGRELPPDLQVKRLPAWIISTDKREAVLDGVVTPEKFITRLGAFIIPSGVEAEKPGENQQQRSAVQESGETDQGMSSF